MKYVSPQTEKRRKQQKKRRKQLLCGAVLLCIITAVVVLAVTLAGKDGAKPSSSENVSSDITVSETVSSEVNSSENVSSKDISSAENKPTESKNKKSVFAKIKGLFSRDKEAEAFPAISFGRQIHQPAQSIISLSPLATEAILSSPSQKALVAVSEYCNKRGNELMTVGTPLIPKVDKIIQLAPEYLIVQNPLGEQDKIKLEQSGITVLQLNAPKSIEDLQEIYRSVTALTKGAEKATQTGTQIAEDIREKLSLYSTALADVPKKSAVMLFNSYGMVATADTTEAKLLSVFFDVNIEGSNYFTESHEAVAATDPQVLIVSDTISEAQLADMGFGETSAVKNGNVYYVSIQEFENMSLKAMKTLMGIANSVYGDAIQPAPVQTEEDK